MPKDEQQYEFSEFSGEFVDDEGSVFLRIYRPAGTNLDWMLEVLDEEENTTVWDGTFDTDRDAFEEFLATVERDGIRTFSDQPVQKLH
ncbi:hypothetical protein PYH37_005211 [Sinorhizobium numidicum]|uniref:Uncharacterized protein n=1 Tax=Sinorhizobium numidicum TaxID=680248 RepID=A0ABY8CY07_9HYPH|nr:hypothetical protein [Sinorhizobium numidicum]WEX76860.1 hypothetical protein PYH37_005211 [Sinorhizobium numidicum]WEX83520.1 hypothetical protein PYH38_002304 [Sinorhizobium numidicum]